MFWQVSSAECTAPQQNSRLIRCSPSDPFWRYPINQYLEDKNNDRLVDSAP
jgi:hypothetical protein